MFPEKLTIISTDNELKLLQVIKTKTQITGKYEYLTGYYHKGSTIEFTEEAINKMIRNNIVK